MSEQKEQCWCRHCETERLKPLPMMDRIFERSFIVCPDCGNKRCPKATCHGHKCGSSNDSGQTGSEYGIETCAACHQSAPNRRMPMVKQKEQSWCHCSLSDVEPICGKPMNDDSTDFCENMLPDGTYCAHSGTCHQRATQGEVEP